jgi:hypothetical protein
MKTIAALFALVGLLCACSSAPTTQTSLNGMHYTSAPTSIHDPRLAQPQFYRDEGDNAWWAHAGTRGMD